MRLFFFLESYDIHVLPTTAFGSALGASDTDVLGVSARHLRPQPFWEKDPSGLVGRRVAILWSKGQKYEGEVTSWDAASKKHHVVYDDGDQKW